MRRILAAATLTLLLDVATIGQQPRRLVEGRFREGMHAALLISNTLAKAHTSASLEFNGRCGPDFLVPDFPPIREPKKPYSKNPAETLGSIFSIDRVVRVSQGSNGTIRVVEAGVQTDILQIRISHLHFYRTALPDEAFAVVLTAPELQSFLQSHGIGQPFSRNGGLVSIPTRDGSPSTELPTISGELNNTTLAEAFDYVLKTFPGFWLYQNCESFEGQRIVYFGLFPEPGAIWIWDSQTLVN